MPIKIKKKVTKKSEEVGFSMSDPESASGTTKIIKAVGNERVVDPKGSPEFTRMIPKVRERKRKNRNGNDFYDISKL